MRLSVQWAGSSLQRVGAAHYAIAFTVFTPAYTEQWNQPHIPHTQVACLFIYIYHPFFCFCFFFFFLSYPPIVAYPAIKSIAEGFGVNMALWIIYRSAVPHKNNARAKNILERFCTYGSICVVNPVPSGSKCEMVCD